MLMPRRKLDNRTCGSTDLWDTGDIITGNPQNAQVITELKIEAFNGGMDLLASRPYHSMPNFNVSPLSTPSTPEYIPPNTINDHIVPCCGIDDVLYIDEEQDGEYCTPTHLTQPNRNPDSFLKLCKDELSLKLYYNINVVIEIADKYDKNYLSVNLGEEVVREMIMCSIHGFSLKARVAMAAYRSMMNRVTTIAKTFPGFENLPLKCQSILLKRHADLIISLQGSAFFHFKNQGVKQILSSLGAEDHETARVIVAEVHHSSNAKDENFKGLNYKNFNTLQEKLDNTPSEIRYDQLLSKVGAIITFDEKLIKLLSYVILFCIDSYDEFIIDTKTEGYISKVQDGLIAILQEYIFTTYSKTTADKLFPGVMECIRDLREICYIKRKRKLAQISSHTLKSLIYLQNKASTIKY